MTDLSIWTVYDHPRDWPEYYVARRFEGLKPTNDMIVFRDLEGLRVHLASKGLVHLDRMAGDDPVILETWI